MTDNIVAENIRKLRNECRWTQPYKKQLQKLGLLFAYNFFGKTKKARHKAEPN